MATLRKGDGFRDTTPDLRGEIERLQRALRKAGYDVEIDGLFGPDTAREVKRFQRVQGLPADGVVDPDTWKALRPHRSAAELRPPFASIPGFETFRGDLAWVHAREGHAGKPYWPGDQSGVTLDPGFDLGYQGEARTRELYDFLDDDALDALCAVCGSRGPAAKGKLAAAPALRRIRISRARAAKIMPHVAVRYWTAVADRFPRLRDEDTPASLQTALLSLAYNRGARNRGLGPLRAPIRVGDWLEVASLIGGLQQDHSLQGIRIRRRQEADLIHREIGLA